MNIGKTSPRAARTTVILAGILVSSFALARPARSQTAPAADPAPAHTAAVTGLGLILGRPVFDSDGQPSGSLVDVAVEASGRPVAAILDVGGFLGVGVRRVAVAWPLLRFESGPDGTKVTMAVTLAAAAAAAEAIGPDGSINIIDGNP